MGRNHVDVEGFTGLDALLPLLPGVLRRRIVAHKVWRHYGRPEVLEDGDLTFRIVGDPRVYEVMGPSGRHQERKAPGQR